LATVCPPNRGERSTPLFSSVSGRDPIAMLDIDKLKIDEIQQR